MPLPDLLSPLMRRNPQLVDMLGATNLQTLGKRLIVITGDNASGKSVLRRFLKSGCEKMAKFKVLEFSQEQRIIVDPDVYFTLNGDEQNASTGFLSVNSVVNGFFQSLREQKPHVLIYDEPEIGMGEELALGTAIEMRDFYTHQWPANLQGVIVTTHNRHFVSELMKVPEAFFYNVSGKYANHEDWLNRPIVPARTIDVQRQGDEMFKRLLPIIGN